MSQERDLPVDVAVVMLAAPPSEMPVPHGQEPMPRVPQVQAGPAGNEVLVLAGHGPDEPDQRRQRKKPRQRRRPPRRRLGHQPRAPDEDQEPDGGEDRRRPAAERRDGVEDADEERLHVALRFAARPDPLRAVPVAEAFGLPLAFAFELFASTARPMVVDIADRVACDLAELGAVARNRSSVAVTRGHAT